MCVCVCVCVMCVCVCVFVHVCSTCSQESLLNQSSLLVLHKSNPTRGGGSSTLDITCLTLLCE